MNGREPPRKGPFIALSADFFDDPDIGAAGHMPALLYLQMACRSRQLHSDGWLHESHVRRLGIPNWRRHITRLVNVGLITQHTDANGHPAWYLPAYLKWNYSEEAWQRRHHEGRIGACKLHHRDPPPCDRPTCRESHEWLRNHTEPVAPPMGTPQAPPVPRHTPTPTP